MLSMNQVLKTMLHMAAETCVPGRLPEPWTPRMANRNLKSIMKGLSFLAFLLHDFNGNCKCPTSPAGHVTWDINLSCRARDLGYHLPSGRATWDNNLSSRACSLGYQPPLRTCDLGY